MASSDSGSQMTTISDDTAAQLQTWVTPVKNGWRRLSTRVVSPPQQTLQSAVPHDDASASLSADDFAARHAFEEYDHIEIPHFLDSEETVSFMGFTQSRASSLFKHWRYASQSYPDLDEGLLPHVMYNINSTPMLDCTSEQDDWEGAMVQAGISEQLRAAMMLPQFEHLRYTAPLKFWICETVSAKYAFLESLDRRVRAGLSSLSLIPKTTYQASVQNFSSDTKKSGSTLPKLAQSIFESPLERSPGTKAASTTTKVAKLAHHTTLYRATTMEKAQVLYDTATGTVDLHADKSAPGDFSGETAVCYWTPQRQTADQYAHWLKNRVRHLPVAIVQIFVPEAFTNSLDTEYLWSDHSSSDEWRQIVWASRRGYPWPKAMEQRENDAQLLVGHILSGKHIKYLNMPTYKMIKSSDRLLVSINGEDKPGEQWVFRHRATIEAFHHQCAGKGFIFDLGSYAVQFSADI